MRYGRVPALWYFFYVFQLLNICALIQATIVDDSDVVIAVMGATGSGKTTFINMASGSNLRVGMGLQSCTSIVQVAQAFELQGQSVTLIDTPGFDDTTKSDSEILRMIAAFLATAHHLEYIHRVSAFRMGGVSTKNFKMFRQLCGDSTLKNVEYELATQDMFFKPVLDKGALMLRHNNTSISAHKIIEHILDNHPLPFQIQVELVDEKKDISETAAGEELNRELMLQMQKHRNEMRTLQEQMEEAIRTKDEETKQELEIATSKLQAEMDRMQADSQKLASEYNEAKSNMEKRMQELAESARRDAERASAQIDELRRQASRRGGGLFGLIGRAIDDLFD